MFDWATGTSLNRLIEAGVPAAAFDPWLEGWMVARACHGWDFRPPLTVLDVEFGPGERPYRDAYRRAGASVTAVPAAGLGGVGGTFDLVTVLSFRRGECLRPLDFGRPFEFPDLLLRAAARLGPGGTLFWGYLYAYPADPDDVHDVFEPMALHNLLTYRGYQPVGGAPGPVERLRMLHDGDTLFVGQKAILEQRQEYRKVLRVFGAVHRPGPGAPRVVWADGAAAPPLAPPPPPEKARPAPPRPAPELSGRQLVRLLARRAWRKAGRLLVGGTRHV